MAAAELEVNPPSSPFFKEGTFLCGISNPSLKKEEGEILDGMTRESYSELMGQNTSTDSDGPMISNAADKCAGSSVALRCVVPIWRGWEKFARAGGSPT